MFGPKFLKVVDILKFEKVDIDFLGVKIVSSIFLGFPQSFSFFHYPMQMVNLLLLENNVAYKFQSFFKEFHWTGSCLLYLHDKIAKGFNSDHLTRMVLTDSQKAF